MVKVSLIIIAILLIVIVAGLLIALAFKGFVMCGGCYLEYNNETEEFVNICPEESHDFWEMVKAGIKGSCT